jgi:hypothetical protein
MASFKFLFNGIKVNNGELQRASYVLQSDGTLFLRARDPEGFSQEIWEAFDVKNESDPRTDFHENDLLRIAPAHPLFKQAKAGLLRSIEHNEKCATNRMMRKAALHLAY